MSVEQPPSLLCVYMTADMYVIQLYRILYDRAKIHDVLHNRPST